MKRILAVLALVFLVCVPSVAAAQSPQSRGTLIVESQSEPDLWDPQRSTSALAFQFMNLLYDTLVVMDWDVATIQPHIAESWTISEDGRTYTFNLRDDVKFHSGRPMTAQDWVWTFERLLSEELASPHAWRLGQVKEISAPDDTTLVIELEKPYSDFLTQLTMSFLSVIDRESVEQLGDQFGINGAGGTGPFQWVRWDPGQELVLERNPDYTWGPSIHENTGPAYIETIIRRQVPELTTYLFELELGNVNVALSLPPIQVERLRNTPGVKVVKVAPRPSVEFLGLKTSRPMMSDVRMRRAVSYAVNREELAETVWFGQAEVAQGIILPSTPGYSEEAEELWAFNNQEKARELLEEMGWTLGDDGIRYKDGEPLTLKLLIPNSSLNEQLAAILQAQLREVGIDLEIEMPELSAFWGITRTETYDIFFLNYGFSSALDLLGTYFDSRNMPAPNRMSWDDPRTDELLRLASEATNDAKRNEYLAEVQNIVAENALWVPLVNLESYIGVTENVHDLKVSGHYLLSFGKLLDVWME